MKTLITGSTGMVGRNFSEDARLKEHQLILPRRPELDLTDRDNVRAYMAKHKPDLVVHCASRVGGIAANIKSPVEFLMDNIDINLNVIDAAYRAGVPRLLNLSSSCIYPRFGKNPLTEEQILGGELEPTNEGYALAKISALKLCSYINKQNPGLKYTTLIPCNLYGKYDHFDPVKSHLIPAIILKLHEAKEQNIENVSIWGDGQARREFMYVSDLVDFMIHSIANFDSIPELINVGLGYDYSINEYYEVAAKIVGFKGGFTHDLSKPVGMKQKLVDNQKIKTLGWEPKISITQGIQKAYDYYIKEYQHGN